MAGTGDNTGAQDISAHRESYTRFLGWAKIATAVSFITAAVVTVILAS